MKQVPVFDFILKVILTSSRFSGASCACNSVYREIKIKGRRIFILKEVKTDRISRVNDL